MKEEKIIQDKEQKECLSSARHLDWESGHIRSIDDAVRECDKVETCKLNCKCMLREAYMFYLNEQYKREKDFE